ncbi:MAG: Crp/Fnr family transcriptional regulator [bacterium]
MNKYQSALREVPLFNKLSQKELKVLERASAVKSYERNEVIIHKHDIGDTFFSILSGKVKVILTDDPGKEFIVGILKPKEFFGELSLLDGEPRSASVVALEPTEVLVLRREDFLEQIKKHPEIPAKIMTVLARRLRDANLHIGNLAFLDVCGRLARVLIDIAKATGKKQEDGIFVSVEYNRSELAHLVGTTRETLTRALKTLKTMGYIKLKKGDVIITDEKGLRQRMG